MNINIAVFILNCNMDTLQGQFFEIRTPRGEFLTFFIPNKMRCTFSLFPLSPKTTVLLLVAYCRLVWIWTWTTPNIAVSKIPITPCQMLLRKIPQQWTNVKYFSALDSTFQYHIITLKNVTSLFPNITPTNKYSIVQSLVSQVSPLLWTTQHYRTTQTQ